MKNYMEKRKFAVQEIVAPVLYALLFAPIPYLGSLHLVAYYIKMPTMDRMSAWRELEAPFIYMRPFAQLVPALFIGWALYCLWRRRGAAYGALAPAAGFLLSWLLGRWFCHLAPASEDVVWSCFEQQYTGYGAANLLLLAVGLLLCGLAKRREVPPAAICWRSVRPLGLLSLAVVVCYGLYPALLPWIGLKELGGDLAVRFPHIAANHLVLYLFILLLGGYILRHGLHPLWFGVFYGGTLALSGAVLHLSVKATDMADRLMAISPNFALDSITGALEEAAKKSLLALFFVLLVLALAWRRRALAPLCGVGALWCAASPVLLAWSRQQEEWGPWAILYFSRSPSILLCLLFVVLCIRCPYKGRPLGLGGVT